MSSISPSSDPAASVVCRYLAALRDSDGRAAKALLARRWREDPKSAPEAPFEILGFEVEKIEPRGDVIVVWTGLRGREESGSDVEERLPFVLVDEEGDPRIDPEQTFSLQATGQLGADPADVLVDAVADTLSEGFAEGVAAFDAEAERMRCEQLSEALEGFRKRVRDDHRKTLRRVTGVPDLAFEVKDEAFRTDREVREIDRLIDRELPGVFMYLGSEEREQALSGMTGLVVDFSDRAADRGVTWEDGVLTLTLPTTCDLDGFHASVSSRALTLLADEGLADNYGRALGRLGSMQDWLREEWQIEALCDADWARFTRSFESLENAWALWLLLEKGIVLFWMALEQLLPERKDVVEAARGNLKKVLFEPAQTPGERVLEAANGEIRYVLFLAETYEDYWTPEDLAGLLPDVLKRL